LVSGPHTLSAYVALDRAKAWVEAENIHEVWGLVQKWFALMESGEAENHYPDPTWEDGDYPNNAALTSKVADKFIEEIDADFMIEKNRFQGRSAPEFSRLPPHARLAFVQEAYRLIKTQSAIDEEAQERLDKGEVMPPPSVPA